MLKILLLALCGSIHASHIPALRVDISRTECQKNERKKTDYFAVFAFVLVAMYVVARLNLNYTVKKTHNFVLVFNILQAKAISLAAKNGKLKTGYKNSFFCGTYRV